MEEEPVRPALGEPADPRGVHEEVVLWRREVLAGVVHVANDVAAECRRISREEAPATTLFGVVRQRLVEPQDLGLSPSQQDMLVVADHVLELVHERDRHELLDLVHAMHTAERSRWVRHDRVEDLAVVVLRRERGIDVHAEEVTRHEARRLALRRRDELVDLVRHEDDDHTVSVDV